MITETALITGASSGIGLHLAHEFARRRHPVVITAPVESKLQRIRETFKTNYNITARVIAKDLERPNAAQENLRRARKRIRRWFRAWSVAGDLICHQRIRVVTE